MSDKSVWIGIRRGLACRCPNCGKGRLFTAFLKPTKHCEVCGADNSIYPSDDLPPYLTVAIVGHVVVALYLLADFAFTLPVWLQFSIWLPFTALLSFALLPLMKGVAVGICWATDTIRKPAAKALAVK